MPPGAAVLVHAAAVLAHGASAASRRLAAATRMRLGLDLAVPSDPPKINIPEILRELFPGFISQRFSKSEF